MRKCLNCGELVSSRFARVFGDNEDDVYACPSCRGMQELYDGAAALPNQTVAE